MNDHALETLRALAQQRQGASYPIMKAITEAVAVAFGVTAADIMGRDRHRSIAEARATVCYVARRCTRMSFPELGRVMGLDQSTVRSAVLSVQARRARERWTDSVCAVLLAQFGQAEE